MKIDPKLNRETVPLPMDPPGEKLLFARRINRQNSLDCPEYRQKVDLRSSIDRSGKDIFRLLLKIESRLLALRNALNAGPNHPDRASPNRRLPRADRCKPLALHPALPMEANENQLLRQRKNRHEEVNCFVWMRFSSFVTSFPRRLQR
jgi:hypothetical protein